MKAFYTFMIFFLLLLSIKTYTQTDPNNDPYWDWRQEVAWTLYPSGYPLGTALQPNNPFYQGAIGAAVYDNLPEDGWVLLKREFSISTRQIALAI